MTIQSDAFREVYTGNGALDEYDYTWKIYDKTQLLVTEVVIATGAETVYVVDVDYTVTGINDDDGGTIILTAGNLPATKKIVITPNFPFQQDIDLTNQASVPPERAEEMGDKLAGQIKQIKEKLDRAVTVPIGSTVSPTDYLTEIEAIKDAAETAETNAEAAETLAESWANLTTALVDGAENSAKSYAVGGTGAGQPTAGDAKSWATKTSATVEGGKFSSKEYAQGTQAATGGSAKNWAQQTGADVTGAAANSRSAKSWAQDALTGATLQGSAKDWAQHTGGTVDGTNYSAKYHAQQAAASDASAAGYAAAAASASAEGLFNNVVTKSFADSPIVPLLAEEGMLYRISTAGGNVVVNLSSLATYGEDMKFAFMKETGDVNTITINRGGTDTINGATSVVLSTQYDVHVLVGDSAGGTWADCIQAATIAPDTVTNAMLVNMAAATIKGRASGAGTGDPTDLTGAQVATIIGNATTSAVGVVELATDAEAQAKSDTGRVLTPANLAAIGASATFSGLVELATNAETKTGTDTGRAITPANLASTKEVQATQATTSGTSKDFTITGAKRVTLTPVGVSGNGTSTLLIQMGDGAPGIETTGYLGAGSYTGSSTAGSNFTTGFGFNGVVAANVYHGTIILTLVDAATNTWVASGVIAGSNTAFTYLMAGSKSLSAAATTVRLTWANGTDAFDAGLCGCLVEY